MNFGGLIASGIHGAADAAGNIAKGYINQERQIETHAAISKMEEEKAMRIAEFNANMNRQGAKNAMTDALAFQESSADRRRAIASGDADAKAADAQRTALSEAKNVELQQAKAEAARREAISKNEIETGLIKQNANDDAYLAAMQKMIKADPVKAAQIASSNASAANSAASARLHAQQFAQLQQVGIVADKVRGLQVKLSETYDSDARMKLERQISDLGFSGKSAPEFLKVAERAMDNGAQALKIKADPMAGPEAQAAAGKQLEQSQQFARKAAEMAGIKLDAPTKPGPPVGTVVNGLVFKGGDPNDKASWEPQAKPEKKPSGLIQTARAPEVDPPDSPAGKAKAKREEIRAAQELDRAGKVDRALAQYEQMPRGDIAAAARLQDSELFRYLPIEKQREISRLVLGR